MDSIYMGLALYDSKNECARSNTVSLPISEVCDGTVSLAKLLSEKLGMGTQFCQHKCIFCHKSFKKKVNFNKSL